MTTSKVKKVEDAKLTNDQKTILTWLTAYLGLTTSQLWQVVNPSKRLRSIRYDLDKLKYHKMVKSFKVPSLKLGGKENCWQLLKLGAVAIDANYDDRYSHKPTQAKMKSIAEELAIKEQVMTQAGWELVQPKSYNSANEKPKETEQYTLILEAYRVALLTNLQERRKNAPGSPGLNDEVKAYNAELYKSLVPKDANDWLAYLDIYNAANKFIKKILVVMIFTRDDVGIKFWNHRCKQYAKTAEKIIVVAVFPNSTASNDYKDLLAENHIKVTNINNLSRFLTSIKEKNG
jgi:hypothetical protein